MPNYIIYQGKTMTEEEYIKIREEEGNSMFVSMGHFYDNSGAGGDIAANND